MPLNDLADLFHDELRDILSAERQLIEAIPKMAKMASNDELKKAFENHLEQTRIQVTRVEAPPWRPQMKRFLCQIRH